MTRVHFSLFTAMMYASVLTFGLQLRGVDRYDRVDRLASRITHCNDAFVHRQAVLTASASLLADEVLRRRQQLMHQYINGWRHPPPQVKRAAASNWSTRARGRDELQLQALPLSSLGRVCSCGLARAIDAYNALPYDTRNVLYRRLVLTP
jgi:hypothetical protein